MSDTNKPDQYVEYLNNHILPHINYDKLQESYDTDMIYAKGILNRLHEAMVSVYGGELLDETDGDEGIVVIPGVIRGKDSGNVCLALLDLDLSSSGEHWGTAFLCKSGVISQNEAFSDKAGSSEMREAIKTYAPYDYCYTATIPDDIHVDFDHLPEALKDILSDFQKQHTELVTEAKPISSGRFTETDFTQAVVDVQLTAQEFGRKMRELLPGASKKAIEQTVLLAEELDKDGIYPKGAFYGEQFVCFYLAVKQYGADIASEVFNICEYSCFSYWEILGAAQLVTENVPHDEIIRRAADRELFLGDKQFAEIKTALEALKNGTLSAPAVEKPSVREQIRSAAEKHKKPRGDKPARKKGEPEL